MDRTTAALSAARAAALVADFDRSPAYVGLADALMLAIGDGRVPLGARLPSERELTARLGVSRTTVTRAYARLRETGYAAARQGAGTFAQVPGGRSRAHDRALLPRPGDGEAIDLGCAAATAPPGLAAAYAEAGARLPAYLGSHGYFPAGLPRLQAAIARSYAERGLPTEPDQVMVTPGALSAAAVVARALSGRGERALVESPTYPNAVAAIGHTGARLVAAPVDPHGWDLAGTAALLRRTTPRLAYLVPDFQNPTGLLMDDAQRADLAGQLRRCGTVAVVDEAHQALALEGQAMPRPFAAFAADAVTIGSASKSFWGGLRLGWIRAPRALMDRLTRARVATDLGAPVLEQLVLALLLEDGPVLPGHRERLREQRDALVEAVGEHLPQWRFRVPGGGLALWCELPSPGATALAERADRAGVILTPGPVFAVEGGLDRFVRIPWTRPAAELREAVRRLAAAWESPSESGGESGGTDVSRTGRVLVA